MPKQGPSCPAGTSPLHHLAGVKLRALEGGCCRALPRALLGTAICGHATGVAVLRVLGSLLGSLARLADLGFLQPSLIQDCINLLLCLQRERVSQSEEPPVVKQLAESYVASDRSNQRSEGTQQNASAAYAYTTPLNCAAVW